LQNFTNKYQVPPPTLLYRAMVAPKSIRRRDVGNNDPEKQVSSGNNILAFGKEVLNTSLKNRNKTAHRWRNAINSCQK
jgi:hypothetical protein